MDVFGLTPIDAALAAWGLNSAQQITRFLFIETPVGWAAFGIGFLWSLWEAATKANFKHFAGFVFISLTGILLFITPVRQEPTIKSAQEAYGSTISITAKTIKDAQTNEHSMPVILSFIGQMADAISVGVISTLDNTLASSLGFLKEPFGIQKLSLQANQVLHGAIADVGLQEDLGAFMYAHYLPSLIMHKNEQDQPNDLNILWPGNTKILQYYSPQQKTQWQGLKDRLTHVINDPQEPWVKVTSVLDQINRGQNDINEQIMSSIINGQLDKPRIVSWLTWVAGVQAFFPYVYGGANFCLYLSFPFLMLALMVFRRMGLLLGYLEIFIWIKSWVLTAAMGYYMSLMAAYMQAKSGSSVSWFWEYPYYVAVASVFLCVTPILTLIGIHRGFQFVQHR